MLSFSLSRMITSPEKSFTSMEDVTSFESPCFARKVAGRQNSPSREEGNIGFNSTLHQSRLKQLQCSDDRVGEFIRRRVAAEIAGDGLTFFKNLVQCSFDTVRCSAFTDVSQ